MADVPVQTPSSELQYTEFNNITEGLRNLINTTSQTASSGDTNQYAKSAAEYAASGWFYTDSGAADAYVLTNIGTLKSSNDYGARELISFRAANANTGASTVNVATKGVKNIKKADGSTDPAAGDIPTDKDTWARYDGTNFRLIEFGSGAGGSTETVTKDIAQGSHGFVVGDVLKQIAGVYSKAQADTADNAEVIGIVSAVADAGNFTLQMNGYISGLSGLTASETHFLSPTVAGALTATKPTTIGQIDKPLLDADTTSSGFFNNMRGLEVTATGDASAMVKLSTATASASATIDFEDIDSTYSSYRIDINGVLPTSDGVQMHLRVGTGVTPTYQSGVSDYSWTTLKVSQGTVSGTSDEADSQMQLTRSSLGSAAGEEVGGSIVIYNPASGSADTIFVSSFGHTAATAGFSYSSSSGQYLSTTPVTALRILMASSTIASGVFTLYGIK